MNKKNIANIVAHKPAADDKAIHITHPTRWAGLCYVAGNILLAASGRQNAPQRDALSAGLRTYAMGAYNASTLVRMIAGWDADKALPEKDIVQDAYNAACGTSNEGGSAASLFHKASAYMVEHVWEVSSAISLSGNIAHLASIVMQKGGLDKSDYFEAASPVMSVLATGTILGMPEQQHTQDGNGMQPLTIAAGLQSVASSMFAASAFKQKPVNYSMVGAAASYLSGNMMQTQATKNHIADNATILKEVDTLLASQSNITIEQRTQFAKQLAAHDQVDMSEQDIIKHVSSQSKKLSPQDSIIFSDSSHLYAPIQQRDHNHIDTAV